MLRRVAGVDSPFQQAICSKPVCVCVYNRDKEMDAEYLLMLAFKGVCICVCVCPAVRVFNILHLFFFCLFFFYSSLITSLTIAAVELKSCLLNTLFIQIPVPMLERAREDGSEMQKP